MLEDSIMKKVFAWLFLGLLVSFGTAFYVSGNENMLYNIFSNSGTLTIIIMVELIFAFTLSLAINKLPKMGAIVLFLLYSLTTGLTLSIIFVAFEMSSIISVFAITAFVFGLFAVLGYFTKIDLTKMSTFLFMGLLAAIIGTIINIFLNSSSLDMLLSIAIIIIFIGFIAYDIQKIKKKAYNIQDPDKMAIYAAFQLYLDFINLFIRLLQIFGRRK